MAGSRRAWAGAGVASVRGRRVMAPGLVLSLVASLLVSTPVAAAVDPELPVGASREAPQQAPGAAEPREPSSTQDSQGRRGPGAPAELAEPALPKLPAELDTAAVEAGLRVPATEGRVEAARAARQLGGRVEDRSARTATSTEYVNPDGSVTRFLYEGTAFVPAAAGSEVLLPVSTVLDRGDDGRWAPRAASVSSFAGSADAPNLAVVTLPDSRGTIGYRLAGAAASVAELDAETRGTRLLYQDVFEDVDLYLGATAEGIKDDLVLRSPSARTAFEFPLIVPQGVTPVPSDDGGVRLVDAGGDVVASVRPGFMYDSSVDPAHGGPAMSTAVYYTVARSGQGGWTLRMALNEAWLGDPERVWPVTVDPLAGVGSAADDLFVSSRDYSWTNTSGFNDMTIGTYDWGGEKSASYLHFDLSGAAGIQILDA